MTENPKWKRFEDLAAHIQQSLSPEAAVTQNEHIFGKRSKRQRQIDITVRKKVGQYDLLIVIDCKDYKRPVDVKDVESFIGLTKDVGANKGAIISSKGFTKSAHNRAADAGIDLYTLVDAEAKEWQSYITGPVLLDLREMTNADFVFSDVEPEACIEIQGKKFLTIYLYRENGEVIDSIHNLLNRKWQDRLLPIEPGEYNNLELVEGKVFLKAMNRLYPVNVIANITVGKKLFFGQVPIVKGKALLDNVQRKFIPAEEFMSTSLDLDGIPLTEIEKKWKRIESPDELAVEPVRYSKVVEGLLCEPFIEIED